MKRPYWWPWGALGFVVLCFYNPFFITLSVLYGLLVLYGKVTEPGRKREAEIKPLRREIEADEVLERRRAQYRQANPHLFEDAPGTPVTDVP